MTVLISHLRKDGVKKNDMKSKLDWTILGMVLLNLGVAGYNFLSPVHQGTIFVLTPLVDIIPKDMVITEGEKKEMLSDLRYQPEARDIQSVYARLGSTLSLHDLLRGIEFLEQSSVPLSSSQKEELQNKLQLIQSDHRRLQEVQRELIGLEKDLQKDVEQLKRGLR